jgi:hypothetical protein
MARPCSWSRRGPAGQRRPAVAAVRVRPVGRRRVVAGEPPRTDGRGLSSAPDGNSTRAAVPGGFLRLDARPGEGAAPPRGTRPNLKFDFPHLIEEMADLGISQRDAVRSQVRRIIEHCLKLQYSAARDPRAGWNETIIDARTEIEDKITPTIRRGRPRQSPRVWQQARRNTAAALRLHGEHADALPAECAYRLPDLLRYDWLSEEPAWSGAVSGREGSDLHGSLSTRVRPCRVRVSHLGG